MIVWICIIIIVIAFYGYRIIKKFLKKKRKKQYAQRRQQMLELMCLKWEAFDQVNRNLANCLIQMGYKNIAIYGMAEFGERLFKELLNTDVNVKYAIDQKGEGYYEGIFIYKPDDELPKVEAIIVTVPHAYESIKEELEKWNNIPILSLLDLLEHDEVTIR